MWIVLVRHNFKWVTIQINHLAVKGFYSVAKKCVYILSTSVWYAMRSQHDQCNHWKIIQINFIYIEQELPVSMSNILNQLHHWLCENLYGCIILDCILHDYCLDNHLGVALLICFHSFEAGIILLTQSHSLIKIYACEFYLVNIIIVLRKKLRNC